MTSLSDEYDAWARQATAVQAELNDARLRLLRSELTGTSGAVTVSLSPTGDLLDVRIDERVPLEAPALRRDILAAHGRAVAEARALAEDMMRPVQAMIGNLERDDRR